MQRDAARVTVDLVNLGRLLMRHAVDALVLVLAVLGQVEIWSAPISGQTLALALAALIGTLPLLARRRFPFGAPTLVFAALAGVALVDPSSIVEGPGLRLLAFVSLALAFWFAGAHNGGEHAIASVAIGLATTAVVVRSAGREFDVVGDDSDLGVLGFFLIGGGLALAAFALQRRAQRSATLEDQAARFEREREERARAAVTAERTRIARDLHQVIAHSVAVMTAQAGAARLLLAEEPERAGYAALSVEETGRQALADMRRLLGILRTEEGNATLTPQPGMADLTPLLEWARQAGLPVELMVEGAEKFVPPGIDLAAYRIVEEVLTNAVDHPDGSRAQVTVRYGDEALDVEVTTGVRGGQAGGDRHGLVALREQVALYGGQIEAGPRAGGGYGVRAHLPLPSAESGSESSAPTAGARQ
jgi:signal transduction histidine kinase